MKYSLNSVSMCLKVVDTRRASRTSEEAVTWDQKRSKKLKSKKFSGTLYLHAIKQLQRTTETFLGQHGCQMRDLDDTLQTLWCAVTKDRK
jgi:hypothetical protein